MKITTIKQIRKEEEKKEMNENSSQSKRNKNFDLTEMLL